MNRLSVKELPPELAMTGKVGWLSPIMWFWLLMVLWECGCQRQRAIVTHVTCHTPRNVAFMLAPLHGTYMHTQ